MSTAPHRRCSERARCPLARGSREAHGGAGSVSTSSEPWSTSVKKAFIRCSSADAAAWRSPGVPRYAERTARSRLASVDMHGAWRPGGKLPCAPGTYGTQEASKRSPHVQYAGPGTYVSAQGVAGQLTPAALALLGGGVGLVSGAEAGAEGATATGAGGAGGTR